MASEICHVEILAHDMARSREFYAGIFGWEFSPMMGNYEVFKAGAGVGGALMTAPEHVQNVLFYIHVPDIEATLAAITAAGGTVVTPKREISPEIGYMGMFLDPAGNKIGLFTSVGDH